MSSYQQLVIVGATRRTMILIGLLKRILLNTVEITLIHPHSFWLDEQMAIEAIGGNFGLGDIRLDLKDYASRMGIHFIQDKIISILPNRKKIMTDTGRLIEYDCSLFDYPIDHGNLFEDVPVPGHFYCKPSYRVLEIKNEIETLIELNLDTKLEIVLLGGGVDGFTMALQIEELLQQRDSGSGWSITIVEKKDRLLSECSVQASDLAMKFCKMNDIKVLTGTEVHHIQTNRVVLNKGQTCSFDMVIRTYNYCKQSFFEKAGLLADQQGRLLIDEFYQADAGSGLFATGDSGRFTNTKISKRYMDNKKQVEVLAGNMIAFLRNEPMKQIGLNRSLTSFIPLGGFYAMINRGDKVVYGKWCQRLLCWLNQRFMKRLFRLNK